MNQTVDNYLEEMRSYFAGEKEKMSTDRFVYTDQEMAEDVFLQVSNIKGCYWHIWEDGSGSLKRLDGDTDILICDLISAEYKDAAGWYGFERTPDWRGELERLVMEGVIRPLDHGSAEFYFYNDINQDGKRIFVDMDGTLAEFRTVDTMETLYEKGYFANLPAHENVIEGLKTFMKENPEVEVYILSSVLEDSPYAQNEKNAWLDQYIPEIDAEHRIFSSCGSAKCEFVPSGVKEGDILLDDYSKNLHEWPGDAIKLMNGINGTKGSWQWKRIDYQIPAAAFAENLLNLCQEKEKHTMKKEAQEIKETLETELFADEKTGVRDLAYEEKFNMILEMEFPETSGNYELQQELFEHFMKSPVSGFFDEELRVEFQDIIKENEKQQDSVFDFMENLIQNKKASNFSQETEIETEVER